MKTDFNKQNFFDNTLVGLSDLLSTDIIKITIQKSLKSQAQKVIDTKPFYIRYKPETNCMIAFIAEISGNDLSGNVEILLYAKTFTKPDFDNALGKANAHRWIFPELTTPFISIHELNTIVYFFPNDCEIDGLRVLSGRKKTQRELYDYYDRFNPDKWRISDSQLNNTVVRYKPERRAVIHCETRVVNWESEARESLEVYYRIYADNLGEKVFAIQSDLYEKTKENQILETPMPIGYNRDRKIMYMETAPGTVLTKLLQKDSSKQASIEKAAIALSELHKIESSELENQNPDLLWDDIDATTSYLAHIIPELNDDIKLINSKFQKQKTLLKSQDKCFVHGDCHPGQFIIDKTKVSLIDFDRSFTGNRLIDIGNFVATLKYAQLTNDMKNAEDIENHFKETYALHSKINIDNNELSFWIAYGLFKLTVKPFREFRANWPELSSRIIKICLKLLT